MKTTVEKKGIPTWLGILIFLAIMTAIMIVGMML